MKSIFRLKQNKLFDPRVISLYLSYSVGLIIPIIMGVILYVQSSNLAEKDYSLFLEKEFSSTISALSKIINEIDFVTTLAKLNSELTNLAKTVAPETYENAGYYDLYREKVFVSVPLIQHYIKEFQFIFPHNNIAIGSLGVSSLKTLYNYETALAGYTLEEFLVILKQEEKGVPINKYDVIDLLDNNVKSRTMIINTFLGDSQFPGFALFVLNDENIMSTLLELNNFIDGIVYLSDASGEIFYFNNNDTMNIEVTHMPQAMEDIQSSNYISGKLIHYQKSFADLGFVLGTAISPQKFQQKTSFIRNTILITIVILIIIDIIMLIIVSVLRAKPLSRLIDAVQTEIQDSDDSAAITYKNIDENVKKLLINKRDFEKQLNQSIPMMISLVLDSLIHGNLIPENDNLDQLEKAGLFLNTDFRCCFIVQYVPEMDFLPENAFQKFLVKKIMINEYLKKNITGNLNYLEQGRNRTTFVHGGWGDSKDRYYNELIQELKESIFQLNAQLGMNIMARIGNPYFKISKVQQSYEEATLCLDNYSLQPLIEYKQLATAGKKIFYSFETEVKLMNLIRAGKEIEIKELLAVIKKRNFHDQTLPPLKIAVFFNQIKATVSKLEQILSTGNPELDDAINLFLSTNFDVYRWDLFFEQISSLVLSLSKEFTKTKSTRKSSINRIEVEHFIQNNFSDYTLSLTSLSDHFNISEKYFSKYFKEEFNINFHTYLESIRLNYVHKMLENNDLPLKELMKSAGYISERTFTRAFKMKFGKSPSSFRNSKHQTFLYPD